MDMGKISDASQRLDVEVRKNIFEGGNLLSSDINLIDSGDLARLLPQEFQGDIFVKLLDLLLPLFLVQSLTHDLPLLCMFCAITRQHKVKTAFSKEEACGITPCHSEVVGILQYRLCANVGCDIDTRGNKSRAIPRVVVVSSEVNHYFLILARDGHWVVGIYGIGFEMIR